MRWLKTGRQLRRAIKNVHRLRQIVAVFGRHGFADVMDRMDLGKYLPKHLAKRLVDYAEADPDRTVAERLRLAFEELGPSFVKLGQLLSMRPDLLPDSYIEEFTKLQDNVQPLPFETVRAVIEQELGRPLLEAYATFEPKPLAAASIGQVHEATLLSGERVVVKVQRPEIKKIIENDISLLTMLAAAMETYIPEIRIIGPKTIVDEFFKTLSFELDFSIEANNIRKITANMVDFPEIIIPKVYRELSTHKILTLEKLDGIRMNDLPALKASGIDFKHIVAVGARAFFKSVMIDGLFHGDMHGGNLFLLPGNRLGIIDFGIVGRLSQKARDQLVNMVMSILSEDYENLCYQYAELGGVEHFIDFDTFQREVRNAISPYLGLSLGEINAGMVLIEATKIATKHNIKVPGDWMLVFRAILTMEGMGRTLDPQFDLVSLGEEMVKDIFKNQYSMQRLSKEFVWVAKDVATLFRTLPRQIRWMLRKFNSNDFAFEIKSKELQNIAAQMHLNRRSSSLSVLATGLFIASSIALQHSSERTIGEYPLAAVIFFGMGGLLALVLFFQK